MVVLGRDINRRSNNIYDACQPASLCIMVVFVAVLTGSFRIFEGDCRPSSTPSLFEIRPPRALFRSPLISDSTGRSLTLGHTEQLFRPLSFKPSAGWFPFLFLLVLVLLHLHLFFYGFRFDFSAFDWFLLCFLALFFPFLAVFRFLDLFCFLVFFWFWFIGL